jgi:hypothetical protein
MDTWPGHARGGGGSQYICRLGVTKEYNYIFLGTNEYSGIYSALYSLVTSLVNRGI